MPNQTTDCYERVLQALIEKKVRAPLTLIQDFEMAELNAFQHKFPKIMVNFYK